MKSPFEKFWLLSAATIMMGCQIQPPSGSVITPLTHGTHVDEINQKQEENAELAKFIVYQHEFELNLQDELDSARTGKTESTFTFEPDFRIRGYRLTPDGESHVRQIAYVLLNQLYDIAPYVVVEESNTSKRWDTRHRYPVHRNDELDAVRRKVVVDALSELGVDNAEEIVIVAPTFPAGLNAQEAGAAYQSAIYNFGPSGGGLFGR